MKVQLSSPTIEYPQPAPAEAPEIALELEHAPAWIGRDREADLCLDERHVSRQHCQLERVEDAVVVRDMDSKNGTFVNGLQVSEAILKPGDKLTVGVLSFIVEYPSTTNPATGRNES
jgi:two-component system, NtrC family, sensor kinase